ncbi:MAG TPA: hypothetical protein VKN76_12040 [Kiloniellaceae bacterium]|nr:hypothetical protein [Kiloniellaceae bacterium]
MFRGLGHPRVWQLLALGVFAAVFTAPAALQAAEIGASPKVVARAYGEVPTSGKMDVQVPDNSDVNLWVRDTVVANLEQRGYEVEAGAAMVLKVSAQVRSDSWDSSRFSLEGDRGISRFNTLTLNYKVPLGEGKSQPNQTSISVRATLNKDGGRPIWQGTASATAFNRQALDVQPALVAALVDAIGKTVGGSSY